MVSDTVIQAQFWLSLLLVILGEVAFWVILYYVIKRAVLAALRLHDADKL